MIRIHSQPIFQKGIIHEFSNIRVKRNSFCREIDSNRIRASQGDKPIPDLHTNIIKLIYEAHPYLGFWSRVRKASVAFVVLAPFCILGTYFKIPIIHYFSTVVLGVFTLIGVLFLPRMFAQWRKPEMVVRLDGHGWEFENLVAYYVALDRDLALLRKLQIKAPSFRGHGLSLGIENVLRDARIVVGRAVYQHIINYEILEQTVERMVTLRYGTESFSQER